MEPSRKRRRQASNESVPSGAFWLPPPLPHPQPETRSEEAAQLCQSRTVTDLTAESVVCYGMVRLALSHSILCEIANILA
jgi:hypothetical protein